MPYCTASSLLPDTCKGGETMKYLLKATLYAAAIYLVIRLVFILG